MPMWPFFTRKSGRAAKLKEGRPVVVAEEQRPVTLYANNDTLRRTPSRRSSRRRRRSSRSTASMRSADQNSLNLPPADPPFAKHDSHSPPRDSAEDITALPLSKRLEQSPHLRPVTNDHGISYNFQSNSHSSLPTAKERGKLQRPQSLRKRSAHESALPRRKSSKKRKNDHVREEEIRAMSMPLPQKRPAGFSGGGMLRRDSKKVKGSNISLPTHESIHSSMSGASEGRAFRVSALDMFSPRPKIRYSVGSQYYYTGSGPSPTSNHSRNETQKEHPWKGKEKDGQAGKKSKTIDELADTLDAGALREILERDKRRRERKRKADDEKLRRRLERRAEKQKAGEHGGTPATPRKEARGVVGLGIAGDSSTPMEDVRPSTPSRPQRIDTTGLRPPSVRDNSQLPTPLETPVEEPVVADAQAVRYSRASMASPPISPIHTRAPSNISQLPALLSERDVPAQSVEPEQDPRSSAPLHPVESTDTAATSQKRSSRRRSSEGRRMRVFASLFRRGKRNSQDQTGTTPSEHSFSNTSRESMSRQPLLAHLVAPPTQPIQIRQHSSGVPHRTMSKFREDLPEFPLSPPDSRVQSPEVTTASDITARRRSQPPSDIRVDSTSLRTGARTDSPVSPGVPAMGVMSQSLASVDSEGSWLSGKPLNRRSQKSHIRNSVGSGFTARQNNNEDFNASYEELGIPDDEYFRRLTPQPDERRRSAHSGDVFARKPSSTAIAAMAESDDDADDEPVPTPAAKPSPPEEENLVESSVGRKPTIVHRQPRVKSAEALLSFFQAEKSAPEAAETVAGTPDSPVDPDSPTSDNEPVVSLQRAQSVELGKNHVRQLSAGSAKLLDIPAKRGSIDGKRSSTASQRRLPVQDE